MKAKELAKELCTSEENVLKWASECQKDKVCDGLWDGLSRAEENYVRTMHLKTTHPKLFKILYDAYPSDIAYERWMWGIYDKIGGA